MTDNDIICAMLRYSKTNILKVDGELISIGDILDLINRQKAEINFAKYINGKTVGKLLSDYEELQNLIQNAKAEAVKEFAERLDRKFAFYYSDTQCISAKTIRESIQNESKEMVGEN